MSRTTSSGYGYGYCYTELLCKKYFVIKAETRNDCFLCSFYARWFTQMNHSFTHSFTPVWVSECAAAPVNANCARCSFGFVWIENQTKISWICFYISLLLLCFRSFLHSPQLWDGRTNNKQQQKWLKLNLDWFGLTSVCCAPVCSVLVFMYACVDHSFVFLVLPFAVSPWLI